MKGKGLSFDVIVQTAMRLVNEKGYGKFSARELASELNVKAASLYNHLGSMDEVNVGIGRIAAEMQNRLLQEAAEKGSRKQAFTDFCRAYRDFAKSNHQLYLAILAIPSLDQGEAAEETSREIAVTFRRIIDLFELSETDKIHYTRFVRSLLDGFLQMEMAGGPVSDDVTMEDSFSFIIDRQLRMLEEAEKK